MKKQSLGLIETVGYVAAVEAADTGSKAADVTVLGYGNVDAGLITVKFCGEVAAVKAAVTSAAAAAAKVGKVVSVHVIPRPDRQLNIGPPKAPPTPEGNGPGGPRPSSPEKKKTEQPVHVPPASAAEQEASPIPPEAGPAERIPQEQPELPAGGAGKQRPKRSKKKKKE